MMKEASLANALMKAIMIFGRHYSKLQWQNEFIEKVLANLKNQQGELDLAGIPWSLDEFETQKEFFAQIIKYAIEAKAWNYYRYVVEDEIAEKEALKLLSSLEEFGLEQVKSENEASVGTAYHCDIHMGYYHDRRLQKNCLICDSIEPNRQEPRFLYKKIDFSTTFRHGKFYRILPENELRSKADVFKLLDKFCDEIKLISMGNMWSELDFHTAKKMVKNGLTYDLAYRSSKFSTDNSIEENYTRLTSDFWEEHLICCLSNTSEDPWGEGNSYGCSNITHKWTFAIACIIAFRDEVLFSLFLSED